MDLLSTFLLVRFKPKSSGPICDSQTCSIRVGRLFGALLDDRGRVQLELLFEEAEVDVLHQLVVVHQIPKD